MLLLALTVNPDFSKGHANLAQLYVMINNREKAEVHLEKAINLGLNNSMTENLKKILKIQSKKIKN
jgi:hypothetical protein